jgi:Ca-activated chloride channel family protein
MVSMAAPEAMWWLVLPVLAAVLAFFRNRRRVLQQRRLASPGVWDRVMGGTPSTGLLRMLAWCGAGAFVVLALARPQWGELPAEESVRTRDLVVAVDVSDSMLAEDAGAGAGLMRLERAKREITDLLNLLDGDRIALVAFAGTAFLECPLTLDYSAAMLFLNDFDTDLIPIKGTAIADAIRTSVSAFEGGQTDSRAVILITDGEDHSGQALPAAEEAKKRGVRIFTIGIGKPEGAPIPNPDGGFRKDSSGEIIYSKMDETTLQKIALTTGGKYVRSVTGDMDLENIYIQGVKASLKERELESSRQKRYEHRFQWLLALSLLALALEPLLQDRRRNTHA